VRWTCCARVTGRACSAGACEPNTTTTSSAANAGVQLRLTRRRLKAGRPGSPRNTTSSTWITPPRFSDCAPRAPPLNTLGSTVLDFLAAMPYWLAVGVLSAMGLARGQMMYWLGRGVTEGALRTSRKHQQNETTPRTGPLRKTMLWLRSEERRVGKEGGSGGAQYA